MLGSKLNQKNNTYYTPIWVVSKIVKYIPKDKVIWECCCGKYNISNYLKLLGYKVISTDIIYGQDCLTYEPKEHYDIILTNPPFKIKTKIIKRCYDLNKKFFLLVPVNILESKKRFFMFSNYGISYFQLPNRVDYIKEDGTESKSPFWSLWITNIEKNKIVYL